MAVLDRAGFIATLLLWFVAAVEHVFDEVESSTALLFLIAGLCAALVGIGRFGLGVIRFFARLSQLLDLLEQLPRRLDHGSARMARIERHLGLEPLPDHRDVDAA